ncbi:universal stress protein [Yinghuangia seranimata]|uniref:universal stress protein n=1 Tax=Yinghuangia seranimata TaxID=408067 RepID=UPI00248A97D9|nr:universal stress protein [Yinghuangia seranimata]MDI2129524.1 universal stress protein [Yinghuangia seranimata]
MTEQNTPKARGHVIVAVDGSPAAENAVDWAADEAMLRGVDLEILHAWEWKAYEASDWYGHHLHNQGTEVVQTAAERARRRRPDLHVTTTVEHGQAEDVLTGATERAGLLVMGSRGRGGFTGMLLGSVSRAVATEAHCPTLVVRSGEDGSAQPPFDEDFFRIDTHPVLVGVSGESCLPAVEAAFAEAAGRKQRLHAVHAWSFPDLPTYGVAAQPGPTVEAIRTCQQNGETILSRTLGAVRDQHKDVEVNEDVVNDRRAHAMVEASRGASMVVIATRHREGRIGRQIGPVTHALLHHAHAPVLLIPVD